MNGELEGALQEAVVAYYEELVSLSRTMKNLGMSCVLQGFQPRSST